ncbi:hypothetical protein ACFX2J_027156 [Malus domestica]
MADEKDRVPCLDAYLDTRDARITYMERIRKTLQGQNQIPDASGPDDDTQKETRSNYMAQEQEHVVTHNNQAEDALTHDVIVINNLKDDNQDLMGHSVIENMEISMVHVLPAEFQLTTYQPNSLDGDVVIDEATQVDFFIANEDEPANNDDILKTTLAILFPRSSSANLQHLKLLYDTAHIEGYPISKIFVDCGATVNIMLVSVMKVLRRSNDELIPLGIIVSSFIGDKSQTKGVLPLEVNIAGHNHMTVFFIVDSKIECNALLGRDLIHQTNCISYSLYQVLIFWDGKSVMVHPTDNQPFETNMIQAHYYDDHVGYITLQSFNEDGRPTRISFQKAIEVDAETVHQDLARLGLANLIPTTDD